MTLERKMARVVLGSVLAGALAAWHPLPALAETVVPEAEEPGVMTMEPPKPNWFYVRGGWGSAGSSIFDAGTGKMVGMVDRKSVV